MSTRLLRALLAVTMVLMLPPAPARAALVLDTYPASGDAWKPIAIAVPFSVLPPEPVISTIQAALRGSNAPVEIGIMTDQGGLPSNDFLFSQTVSPDLEADLFLSGLSWSVPVRTPLWLAVIESPEFSFGPGYWQGSLGRTDPWAFKATLDGPWFGALQQTPAARIVTARVPEPASLLLLLAAVPGILLASGWAQAGTRRRPLSPRDLC